jgi:hypothetical protein
MKLKNKKMKIKSFMGRRLLLGLTVEDVAEATNYSVELIRFIERREPLIKELNELYDKLEQEENQEK